jgi:hypothetical protein
MPASELVARHDTCRNGLTAENDLCHVRIVRAGTDIAVKSTFCRRSATRFQGVIATLRGEECCYGAPIGFEGGSAAVLGAGW